MTLGGSCPVSTEMNSKTTEDRKNYDQSQSLYIEIYKKDSQNYVQSTSKLRARRTKVLDFLYKGPDFF